MFTGQRRFGNVVNVPEFRPGFFPGPDLSLARNISSVHHPIIAVAYQKAIFQKQDTRKQVGRYTVSMKRVRIDYTIYSPGYTPGAGECWDNRTLRGARKKAQELGVGSLIVRNFNRNKPFDWWQSPFCWMWDGLVFRKRHSLSEKKWKVDS